MKLEASPLKQLIRRREYITGESIENICQQISYRFDRPLKGVQTLVYRVLRADTVTLRVADEITVALDTHVGLVYGFDVYEQGVSDG